MSYVVTQSEVVNEALKHLLETPLLNSQTDDRTLTRALRGSYDLAKAALLRRYPWSFARRRALLSPNAVAPAFGWRNCYQKPPGAVRILPPTVDGELNGRLLRYAIEGREILVDHSGALRIRYIDFVNDGEMSPDFVQILALDLAARNAHSATGKANLANDLYEKRRIAYIDAIQVEIDEAGTIAEPQADAWQMARFGYQDDSATWGSGTDWWNR